MFCLHGVLKLCPRCCHDSSGVMLTSLDVALVSKSAVVFCPAVSHSSWSTLGRAAESPQRLCSLMKLFALR